MMIFIYIPLQATTVLTAVATYQSTCTCTKWPVKH
jgi:hypothetical protein